MEKYELVKDLGSGNFGVARLMRNKETKELVAMKYIERGHKVSFNILLGRSLLFLFIAIVFVIFICLAAWSFGVLRFSVVGMHLVYQN